MEIPENIKQQYSTVTKSNLTNSTVNTITVLRNLTDIIPDDGYYPFYAKKLEELGYDHFMMLVRKARSGSDTPAKLLCWMLKHPELVR